MSTVVSHLLETVVDSRLCRVFVRPAPGVAPSSITTHGLAEELRAAHVAIDELVKQRMQEFLDRLADGTELKKRFLIAEAIPPIEAEPGRFQWAESVSPRKDATGEDVVESLITHAQTIVAKDAVLGRIIPPKDGISGKNVYGESFPPKTAEAPAVEIAHGVRLADDGVSILSLQAGRPVFEEGRISVHQVTQINQDIRPGIEKTDWDTDVIIHGVVNDAANLKSTGSIIVTEAVQAATIQAGQSIVVQYGIIGQSKGRIAANKNVIARFFEDADIEAGGDVFIGAGAVNSRIHARHHIVASNAKIIGGELCAGQCVEVETLGSESGVPTHIYIADDRDAPQSATQQNPEVEQLRQQLLELEDTLSRIQSDPKKMNAAQRERATELDFEISTLKERITELDPFGDAAESATDAVKSLTVLSRIHEGVQVTIANRTASIGEEIKGPLRIELRKVRSATELVVVPEDQSPITVLKSHTVQED